MASTENGATALATPATELFANVSGFDTGDDGSTALGTPIVNASLPAVTRVTYYYKMRALDQNCASSPPTYRTWVVTGSPDANASQYSGAHCGANVSFTDIVVVDTWQS